MNDFKLEIVFQVFVSSLEQKIDETEKKYEETNKISEDRFNQALEAESKITDMRIAMQRLYLCKFKFPELLRIFSFHGIYSNLKEFIPT